jgi:hypothetical protein
VNNKLYQTLRRSFTPLILCAGLATGHAVQAAATFNAETGEMLLPAVMLDWENSLYAVTLKRTTLNTPLTLGDEFEVKALTPNATPEDRNSNFLNVSSTAYVPEVQVGDKTYRLLMQFVPQRGTLRISSMEDATMYSSISGEPSISSYFQRLQQQIHQAEMPATCSDASLYGVYSFATGGTKQVNSQWVKFLEIGVNYFDGQGNVLKAYTNSLNSKTETVKGTYGVLPNCQGEIKYETGEQFYFFTPPMGDKFYYTQSVITNTGSAETGWMERQSKGLEFACSTATLKGTYSYGGRGIKNSNPLVDYNETGLESFDGKGNVTNIYIDTYTGQVQYSRGTYQITPYCDALVTYDSKESNFMHVAPDGESMPFIQYGGLNDGEMFGGMERRVSLLSYDLAPPATATTSATRRSGIFDTNPATGFNLDFTPFLNKIPVQEPAKPSTPAPITMESIKESPLFTPPVQANVDSAYNANLGAERNTPLPDPKFPPVLMDNPAGCAKNHGTWRSAYCSTDGFASRASVCADYPSSKSGHSFIPNTDKAGRPNDTGGRCMGSDTTKPQEECYGGSVNGTRRWYGAGCTGYSNPYVKFP